ncbi:MAG: hypothetical protein KC486_14720 [Myxococcales bacterium]|nr:hypothetical protein [Myxococcales bacterium]
MPKKRYPLSSGSSSVVELEWRGMWKDFTVRVDGQTLGTMNGQGELTKGGSWALADGSTLEVSLAKSALGAELQVLRDGAPLPGSPTDPQAQMNSAAGIAFFIAGLNVLLGVIAMATESQLLAELGLGWGSIVFGAIFLGLGFGIRKGSLIALIAAIALFALDGVLGLWWVIEAGGRPGVGGIVFRVFLIVAMAKAIGAAKTLKASKSA